MLGIILFIATAGLPAGALYLYHKHVLRKKYLFVKNDLLVPTGAALLQLGASHLPYLFLERLPANFIQHSVGGGVAVAITALYFQLRIWPKAPLWQQALFVLAAVNILGNANEILELAAELTTGVIYISTKIDTNIDLVANNLGASIGFIVVVALRHIFKKAKK